MFKFSPTIYKWTGRCWIYPTYSRSWSRLRRHCAGPAGSFFGCTENMCMRSRVVVPLQILAGSTRARIRFFPYRARTLYGTSYDNWSMVYSKRAGEVLFRATLYWSGLVKFIDYNTVLCLPLEDLVGHRVSYTIELEYYKNGRRHAVPVEHVKTVSNIRAYVGDRRVYKPHARVYATCESHTPQMPVGSCRV
jgi:hypothetical protein